MFLVQKLVFDANKIPSTHDSHIPCMQTNRRIEKPTFYGLKVPFSNRFWGKTFRNNLKIDIKMKKNFPVFWPLWTGNNSGNWFIAIFEEGMNYGGVNCAWREAAQFKIAVGCRFLGLRGDKLYWNRERSKKFVIQ